MDKTAVIILHYDNEEDTRACLDSFLPHLQTGRDFQIILVNNSLTESFNVFIKENYPQIEVVEGRGNQGFAKGMNMGIKKALEKDCDYIIILNNDTLLAKDTIVKLVDFAKSDSSIGLVSPKIYFAKGFEYHKNRYLEKERGSVIWYAGGILDWSNIYPSHRGVDSIDEGQFDEIADTDFVTGCCMLITLDVIERLGLFNEKYFLYFEDIDFSIRAKRAGFRLVYSPKTHLWHKNASTSGKPGSPTHIYYQTRNRLYFGYKYACFRTKKALFLDSLKLLFKGGIYTKGVTDYYLGKMGKGSI